MVYVPRNPMQLVFIFEYQAVTMKNQIQLSVLLFHSCLHILSFILKILIMYPMCQHCAGDFGYISE